MSPKDDVVYLRHMLDAIEKIETYISGVTRETFENNNLVIDAVCRELEIIGEASARLSASFKEDSNIFPWSKIVGMRNQLIHGYGEVDNIVVWDTCRNDLPSLKQAIAKII